MTDTFKVECFDEEPAILESEEKAALKAIGSRAPGVKNKPV